MLSQRQQKALSALLTCTTKQDASKQAGISERTLRLYLNNPEFQNELSKRCTEILEDATRKAQRALDPAIECLTEIVKDRSKNDSVRVASARAILSATCRLTELYSFEKRLLALEEVLDDQTYKTA